MNCFQPFLPRQQKGPRRGGNRKGANNDAGLPPLPAPPRAGHALRKNILRVVQRVFGLP